MAMLSLASVWLRDNFYLIKEQIQISRMYYSKSYSQQLPQFGSGPGMGLPRVYGISFSSCPFRRPDLLVGEANSLT
jgi:hypothetical protein